MQYDKTFKLEAIQLSDEIGVKKAAEQLGISYYTLTDWRHKRNKFSTQAFVGSGHKQQPVDEAERRICELEKQLQEERRAKDILKEALVFFVNSRKK